MKRPPLFYWLACSEPSENYVLSGPEVAHITGAKRLREGAELDLTDGLGAQVGVCISAIDRRKKTVELEVLSRYQHPKPKEHVILASAVAKGDRQAVLIDMATQLGVSEIWPIHFEHSVAKASANSHARWQRIVAEAAKQSRRYWFPVLRSADDFAALLELGPTTCMLTAEQGGAPLTQFAKQINAASSMVLVVGPEAGLSAGEFEALQQAGARSVSLGVHILRIETACSAILAAVNQLASADV